MGACGRLLRALPFDMITLEAMGALADHEPGSRPSWLGTRQDPPLRFRFRAFGSVAHHVTELGGIGLVFDSVKGVGRRRAPHDMHVVKRPPRGSEDL